jgi:hypothetical protein
MVSTTPEMIPILFSDPSGSPVLRYERFQLEEVRQHVEQTGFAIVKGLISEDRIERIRSFWTKTFATVKPTGRVTWSPYFGQENHLGFSRDPFQHLFRACDFLWNEPFDPDTREVCLRVHALRNLVLAEDPYFGMRFTDSRYGIFVTASYYPGGDGYMRVHDDGVPRQHRLVHSVIPITFRGRDYKEGGMVVVSRKGQEVDVDGLLSPGDVVLYDGALKHGVKRIEPLPGKTMGRIQIFPIPAEFNTLEKNIRAMARIPVSQFLRAKGFSVYNQLRVRLGRNPAMR